LIERSARTWVPFNIKPGNLAAFNAMQLALYNLSRVRDVLTNAVCVGGWRPLGNACWHVQPDVEV
jgi:hypothetical protein